MSRFLKITLVASALAALVIGAAIAKSSRFDRGTWLGVVTQSVDYDLAEAFDLDLNYGVIVNEVVADSPAEEAGLEDDDIIVAVDGGQITDYDDLVDLLEDCSPGDVVVVKLVRDGEELEVEVELVKRPPGRYDRDWRYRYSYDFDYNPPAGHSRPYLGVQVCDLTRQLGEFFGVEKGRGALISEVEEGSPAEEAGLKAGDVIIAIDADKVRDAGDLIEYILDTDPGDKVSVTVMRNKAEVMIEVEVVELRDGSRYGDLFHDLSFPSNLRTLDARDGLNALDDLDDLGHDLNIQIPRMRAPILTGRLDRDELDRGELKRELKELRRELLDMQKELRDELNVEFEELHKETDN